MSNGDMKVEGHPELVRRRGAIVNVDRDAFIEYTTRRQKEVDRQNEVSELKNQVSELKGLVDRLLDKIG